jgi:hypothetical protein
VGHLGGIFLHRVEKAVVFNYFSTELDIDLIGLSLGPSPEERMPMSHFAETTTSRFWSLANPVYISFSLSQSSPFPITWLSSTLRFNKGCTGSPSHLIPSPAAASSGEAVTFEIHAPSMT